MHNAVKFLSIYHFAGDTNLLNFSKSAKQQGKRVNIDLKLFLHWLPSGQNRRKTVCRRYFWQYGTV